MESILSQLKFVECEKGSFTYKNDVEIPKIRKDANTNLLEETVEKLNTRGLTLDDIIWVGTRHVEISKENFIDVASRTNYDNSYGKQEVAHDLIIVVEKGWFERSEYDGSEWWAFNSQPNRPEKKVIVKYLSSEDTSLEYLEDINKTEILDENL